MHKFLLPAITAMVLSACGGGGGDDLVRFAQRTCSGPFDSSFSGACSVELTLAGDEMLKVEITGRVVATNHGSTAASAARSLHVQAAGTGTGFERVEVQVPAGTSGSAPFTLRAQFPAANLGGAPAIIGLSSGVTIGDLESQVVDVRVVADAR